jgi:Tol biopolymer transport system component
MSKSRIVGVLLGALAVLSTMPSAMASSDAAAGSFVFVGTKTGQSDLYRGTADGPGKVNLTRTAAVNESMPAVSQNGTRVAFVRQSEGIWVMDVDGTGLTQLTTNASDMEPSWFPDGNKLVFTRRQGDRDLWTMNADGSGQVKILDNDVDDETPDVSPDGQWIAFSAVPVGMFIMHPDGSGLQSLGSYSYCRKDQAWAPDSTRFAFTQCEFDGSSNIWVFDLPSFSSTQITPEAGTELQPSWSSDGTSIAYTKVLSATNTAVFAIDPDGSNERAITPTGRRLTESDPSWQPPA